MKFQLSILFSFIAYFANSQGIEPSQIQGAPKLNQILQAKSMYIDEYGDTLYIYEHTDLNGVPDSIFVKNDTIYLRDGSGFVKIQTNPDSLFLRNDTIYLRDGSGFVRIPASGLKGSGVVPRLSYWASSDSLGSSQIIRNNVNQITFENTKISQTFPSSLENIIIGNGGNNTMTGQSNVLLGVNNPGAALTSGASNVMLGQFTGASLTTGSNNFFLGVESGRYINGATLSNVGIGSSSLRNATGNYNIGIGDLAGIYSAGGTLAIGRLALSGVNTNTGVFNIGIGEQSGYLINGGSLNVLVGRNSGYSISSGGQNVSIGSNSSYSLTTGLGNVNIGQQSGNNNSSGNFNVNIGFQSGFNETGSNRLYIENSSSSTPLIGGHFDNNRVGINKLISDIAATLHIGGTARVDNISGTSTKITGFDDNNQFTQVNVGSGIGLSSGAIRAKINGTTNYVSKFITTDSLGNSQIFDNGTNIGIGISSPSYKLDISGGLRITDRTGTAATGAGFTADGQLVAYSLDTAQSAPNTYVTSGTNINVTGSGTIGNPYVINNTSPENDTNEIQVISKTGNLISLTRSGGSFNISQSNPSSNQVLRWDGTNWNASAENTYTEGNGISITSNVITNTGDLSSTNEVIYNVNKLNNSINISEGSNSWVLNVNDADSVATNELQDLYPYSTGFNLSNPNTALEDTVLFDYQASGSGSFVPASNYIAGTGINITGNTISSTVTNTDAQAISKSGNVISITGNASTVNIANGTPSEGQVMTWQSGNWVATTPSAGIQFFDAVISSPYSGTSGTPTVLTLSLAAGTYKTDAFCKISNETASANTLSLQLFNQTTGANLFTSSAQLPANGSVTIPVARNFTIASTNTIGLRVSTSFNFFINTNECILNALKVN